MKAFSDSYVTSFISRLAVTDRQNHDYDLVVGYRYLYSDDSVKFRGIFFSGGVSFFAFYDNLIWQADDCTACTVDSFLFHAEVIRTVGFRHVDFSTCYFTYIGIVDLDHLILCKGISTVYLSVYGDTYASIVPAADKVHTAPEDQGKHNDADDESQFFFLQTKIPQLSVKIVLLYKKQRVIR